MNTQTQADLVVELRRTYPVTRERLFSAWTDPREVRHWFGPEGVSPSNVQMDSRPGGKISITAQCEGGEPVTTVGEFLEFLPPARVVYSWRWIDDPDWEGIDSVVTVEFNEAPGGAELHLTHRRFPSQESRDRHANGWTGSLDKLGRIVRA